MQLLSSKHFSPPLSFQAKLGNSWVSPNVGHLILKYLCPALHEVLQDGLKAYVLDLIIGQRRCQPWSLVEASTQLGEKRPAHPHLLHHTLTTLAGSPWPLETVGRTNQEETPSPFG